MNQQMQELTAKLNESGEEVKQLQPAHHKARNALNEQKKLTRNAHVCTILYGNRSFQPN
jgi:hypothetical protein